MNKYTRRDNDFHNIDMEDSLLLGFQQVKSDPNKVFVWFRQVVERPNFLDRHKTTRLMNNSQRQHDWIKSVWSIDNLILYFSSYLIEKGITKKDLLNLSDDAKSDKWVTADGTSRNFLKCVVLNPTNDITGDKLNAQITQQSGMAPSSVYDRALSESNAGEGVYEELLDKYKDRSMIKSYAKVLGNGFVDSKLKAVYVIEDEHKLKVYEDKELVFGEPNHIFLPYKVADELPVDIYEDKVYIEEEVIVEKELSI